MKKRNDLKWKSEYDADWVEVVPSSGEGNENVTINVKNSRVWEAPEDLKSTVTFMCTNCNTLSADEKIKEVDVCRCACNCCSINPINPIYGLGEGVEYPEKTVKESGLTTGSVIATFGISKSCDISAVTATISLLGEGEQILDTKDLLCDENGNIKLEEEIPYNQSEEAKIYEVKVYFDKDRMPEKNSTGETGCSSTQTVGGCCNPCGMFQFAQDALRCDCYTTISNGNITYYSSYFDNSMPIKPPIPQSGLTKGYQIFSYKLKNYCDYNNISAYIELYLGDELKNRILLDISPGVDTEAHEAKGKATLSEAIPPNTYSDEITVKLYIRYKSENCLDPIENVQKGCDCETALESVDICISTFGVEPEEKIGEFSMDEDTTCPHEKISGYLAGPDDVEYELDFELTDGRNGEIRLGGNKAIKPNKEEKNGKYFQLLVYYNAEEIENPCIESTITQNGVTCNCGDVELRFNDEYIEGSTQDVIFPESGITADTKIASYTLKDGCKSCNNCVKVDLLMINDDETETVIETEFVNKDLYLKQTINENENVTEVNFRLDISYNTAGKQVGECDNDSGKDTWIKCDPVNIKQKGIECSCDNVVIKSNELRLPTIGTDGKFVTIATGDTGLYSKVTGELLMSCGGMFGYNNYSGLIAPDPQEYLPREDNKVLTEPKEDGHTFLIKVNLSGSSISERIYGNVYYIPDGGGESVKCDGKIFDIYIDADACDCITPQYDIKEIPCDGGQTNKIPLIVFENVHENMYIGAEIVEEENPAITNIEVKRVTGSTESKPRNVTVSIYGNVAENDTGAERTAGEIQIITVCMPKPIEGQTPTESIEEGWVCETIGPLEIKQVKCPTCDCDEILDTTKSTFYVDSQYYENENIHIPYNLDEYEYKIASFWGKKNCLDIRIDGQRKCIEENNECDEYDNEIEWLYEYYEEEGETKLWYKVRIEKRIETTHWGTVYENFYLIFKMYTHRTTSDEYGGITPPQLNLLIGFNTKNQEEQTIFNQCSAFTKVVNDNACDCNTFKSLATVRDPNTNMPYYNKDGEYTLKFNGGQLEATYVAFPLEYGDCLEVYIRDKDVTVGEEGWIVTTYAYPKEGPTIYSADVISIGYYEYENVKNAIKVTFTDIVTEDYHLPIVIGYKKTIIDEYGQETITFVPCQEADLLLDVCECNRKEYNACDKNFKLDISKDSTTGSTYVVSSNRDCIKILLYDDSNVYHIGDNYEYKVDGNTLFTAKITGSGSYCDLGYTAYMVKVELASGVNLGNQTYTLKGKYYTDGPKNNGQCNDIICKKNDGITECEFTVTVSQSNCNCEEDVHARICDTSITYSNCSQENSVAVYGNTCLSYYSSSDSCARVKFYLICEGENCGCEQTGEESYCLYDGTEPGGYPPPYNEYLGIMPPASNTTQYITFTQPYQGDTQRITRFIGLWVDNNDEPIIIDEQEGTKCGKVFTITESYETNCSCVCDCSYSNDDLYGISVDMTLAQNSQNTYQLISGVESDIFHYIISKKMYDSGCILVEGYFTSSDGTVYAPQKENYDDTHYKISHRGVGINNSGNEDEDIALNINVFTKKCDSDEKKQCYHIDYMVNIKNT